MDDSCNIEAVVDLEQQFYNAGHADGFAHGRIHGLIEGRAVGRQKGFEIWEEVGYYEGSRHNVKQLIDLISQFPLKNSAADESESSDFDMSKLLNQIRSRYKMLCATLGVKPSLRAGTAPESKNDNASLDAATTRSGGIWKVERPPGDFKSTELSF
ncbi:hypothetical protein BD410DRAFT_371661 [Rickenella mellea]|uniref:Essential protein Yae1 N-terminal domain-containing protein n=1 Tax=Rickenella mellea TaxID=50990 RepID=A0A4Y7Q0Q9_9AGAM|nr:hypothetical protein BD410DRAFT_371661 [Rickenella mellea]